MRQFSYLAVLAACLAATVPLELFLRTRVYTRPLRLALTVVPVAAFFFCWDLYAVSAGHWDFDPASTTGVLLPGAVPVEELLFFLVVPVCAVLTLEAVRAVKGWDVGDKRCDGRREERCDGRREERRDGRRRGGGECRDVGGGHCRGDGGEPVLPGGPAGGAGGT